VTYLRARYPHRAKMTEHRFRDDAPRDRYQLDPHAIEMRVSAASQRPWLAAPRNAAAVQGSTTDEVPSEDALAHRGLAVIRRPG
jgi:DNA-binding IclR family transcriptional regulator